jgi:hypothetical protein
MANEFEFLVILNAYTTVRCTETDSTWKIKRPYNVPISVLEG